jgi:hypothetical protein
MLKQTLLPEISSLFILKRWYYLLQSDRGIQAEARSKPEAAKPESNNPLTKRGKGRPKREVDTSKLPFTAEQVEEELAKEGMKEEDNAPQSPAAAVNKNQPP